MKLGTFLVQPTENKDFDIDYSPWLAKIDDTLDEVDISVECLDDPNDHSFIADRPTITEEAYKFWIKGGKSGNVYKVTILAFSAGGRRDESEIYFAVEDL